MITDFEAGMRKAIREYFPNIILRGCWYHYCAAVRKKCIKLGLHYVLKTNAYAKMILKQVMSLPLLPFECFDEGLAHIKRVVSQCGLSKTFARFFIYFVFWIEEVYNYGM